MQPGTHFIIVLTTMPLAYALGGLRSIKTGRGFNSPGRAMASREAQAFASRYAGVRLLILSGIMAPSAVALILWVFLADAKSVFFERMFTAFVLSSIFGFVFIYIVTERKLRRHFDKNGRAKL